jgi:hypothetical protein
MLPLQTTELRALGIMDNVWQQFLIKQGAQYVNDQLIGFGAKDTEHTDVPGDRLLADLAYLGLLQVSGGDAGGFLQNLLGNDVSNITPSKSQLNSFCTAKGRMLAIFRLFKKDENYLLRMPRELIAPLSKRLQMYVLRSKVNLQVLDDWVGIGISGAEATALLRDHFKSELGQINAVVHQDGLSILRVPGGERYEIYAPIDKMQALWPVLGRMLTPANDAVWRLLDIRNGIPTVYAGTSEHFIPQMVNLQLLDGVSFKKGCYPGQEVVARMQYLGKLKRRMYRVRINTETAPVPGTAIVALDNDRTHEAGEVVDACRCGVGRVEALTVLPIASTGQTLQLFDQTGPRLELLPLPYPFAADN